MPESRRVCIRRTLAYTSGMLACCGAHEQYAKKGVRAALAGLLRLNSTGWDVCNS
jgi:hypothetical protein